MRYQLTIRYGILRNIENAYTHIHTLRKGDKVVIRSSRGVEFGEAISQLQEMDEETAVSNMGEVLYKVTEDDEKKQREIEEETIPSEFSFCQEIIKEHNLPMKLASIEHLFGGKKIIFYFLAKGRVDFRELVKDLAKKYKSRIEMKQIGVRDEARLLAEYEHCGRELCCRTFLKDLEPITMKMAKNQKATLDPSKISGRCGRLMCCLRYEDEAYEELKHNLPKKGTLIVTTKGVGEVVDYDILQQKVTMEAKDNKLVVVSKDEILEQVSGARTGMRKECGSRCGDICE
ncbi:MAG: putative signal peptidase [Candidatus Scalindua rubra]|uniref:Putative signal peptidase n=1 Tax=Candidatus Scalindua rubra TaxID=1872076 RepID=A0A1E3X5E6_9BACT|nr:MAG: putative signal peptidase [Candidatus Scalindua rubra]